MAGIVGQSFRGFLCLIEGYHEAPSGAVRAERRNTTGHTSVCPPPCSENHRLKGAAKAGEKALTTCVSIQIGFVVQPGFNL